jgi:rare lipoprotein A
MRYLFTSAVLALAVSAGASLPAAAAPGDGTSDRSMRVWSDGPGGMHIQEERSEAPRRQRLAYANPRESYDDDDEARPRRRSYDANRGPSRATKNRSKRTAKPNRKSTIAKRPSAGRQASVTLKPTSPAFAKRSLSTDGPKGSGQQGVASFYWQPQRVASGGWFNPNAMTAAHRSLPFGTRVRVTHQGSGRSVDVVINDRGPYIGGRIIDLSKAAAGVIGMTAQGIARVTVQILGR